MKPGRCKLKMMFEAIIVSQPSPGPPRKPYPSAPEAGHFPAFRDKLSEPRRPLLPCLLYVIREAQWLANILKRGATPSAGSDLGKSKFKTLTGRVYHYHPRRSLASSAVEDLLRIWPGHTPKFFLSLFASALLCMSLACCFGNLSSSRFSNLWRGSLAHALVLFRSGPSQFPLTFFLRPSGRSRFCSSMSMSISLLQLVGVTRSAWKSPRRQGSELVRGTQLSASRTCQLCQETFPMIYLPLFNSITLPCPRIPYCLTLTLFISHLSFPPFLHSTLSLEPDLRLRIIQPPFLSVLFLLPPMFENNGEKPSTAPFVVHVAPTLTPVHRSRPTSCPVLMLSGGDLLPSHDDGGPPCQRKYVPCSVRFWREGFPLSSFRKSPSPSRFQNGHEGEANWAVKFKLELQSQKFKVILVFRDSVPIESRHFMVGSAAFEMLVPLLDVREEQPKGRSLMPRGGGREEVQGLQDATWYLRNTLFLCRSALKPIHWKVMCDDWARQMVLQEMIFAAQAIPLHCLGIYEFRGILAFWPFSLMMRYGLSGLSDKSRQRNINQRRSPPQLQHEIHETDTLIHRQSSPPPLSGFPLPKGGGEERCSTNETLGLRQVGEKARPRPAGFTDTCNVFAFRNFLRLFFLIPITSHEMAFLHDFLFFLHHQAHLEETPPVCR
ncbi:hypothetical protein CCUS01_17002 [Colletotrichum cuscutae]|uniref:Uncharacterized protein n=1 Tax=Colletotrichum cuscutae TaxID=1209917 RepID=A0AAI9V7J3_9PEZI|nr:hypothetical protein CCUS01_17002 [Colletotrichum cuscutae]